MNGFVTSTHASCVDLESCWRRVTSGSNATSGTGTYKIGVSAFSHTGGIYFSMLRKLLLQPYLYRVVQIGQSVNKGLQCYTLHCLHGVHSECTHKAGVQVLPLAEYVILHIKLLRSMGSSPSTPVTNVCANMATLIWARTHLLVIYEDKHGTKEKDFQFY